MRALGFREYVPPEHQSYVITTFHYPEHASFDFDAMYAHLRRRGYVIYPGKVTDADCFRIGTIGRIEESDVVALVRALGEVLDGMGINMRAHTG